MADIRAYSQFLLVVKKMCPPGIAEEDLKETADTILFVLREDIYNRGTSSEADIIKTRIGICNILFRSSISDAQLAALLDLGRQLHDYVISQPNTGKSLGDYGVNAEQDDAFINVRLESGSESESEEESTEGSSTGSSGEEEMIPHHSVQDETSYYTGDMQPTRIDWKKVAINSRYLHDELSLFFPAASEAQRIQMEGKLLRFMGERRENNITVEGQLSTFLHECFREPSLGGNRDIDYFVSFLVHNRWTIVYGIDYVRAETAEAKSAIIERLRNQAITDREVRLVYKQATGLDLPVNVDDEMARIERRHRPLRQLAIEKFARSGEIPVDMEPPVVPRNTERRNAELFAELVLPPTQTYQTAQKTYNIEDKFPQWAQTAFTSGSQRIATTSLNPMQTKVFHSAFESDDNLLICAPTGAGKTNVALMCILRVLSNYLINTGPSDLLEHTAFRLSEFKIVYIAPMKALVQEMVNTFTVRLEALGITVAELSGDSGLSARQLAQVQVIVATPEKWDIVTRKSTELGVAALVRLMIIDEVHLLYNDRGPILESIVARTVMQTLRLGKAVRMVGLSATLPNYLDVAEFLQVDRTKGLHAFDASFRPVPLQQTYVAVRKRSEGQKVSPAIMLNEVAYRKMKQFEGQSVMIFVHSRRDTEITARYMLEQLKKEHLLSMLGVNGEENRIAVEEQGADLRAALRDLVPEGFAIHHAGMSMTERNFVEDMFMQRKVKILVCTSTLAWGVNLPAHAVIIKGTRIWSAAKGEMTCLSALDVLQFFGRAGRKGFDRFGEACIISTEEDISYYLRVLNQQMPIESQFLNHLVDGLNAEIALRNIASIAEGAEWLCHTYFYIRARKDPQRYGVNPTLYSLEEDETLLSFREDLVHSACLLLSECKMVSYDQESRVVKSTQLGEIASIFFLRYPSVSTYNKELSPAMYEVELFDLFAKSDEFKKLSVRVAEREEMRTLLANCPMPVMEEDETLPRNKINVLLQLYITGKGESSGNDLNLMCEMVYIKDSAQRILKALYEIAVAKGMSVTADMVLTMYQEVVRQQWAILCPLRQLIAPLRQAILNGGIAAYRASALSWMKQSGQFDDSIPQGPPCNRSTMKELIRCIETVEACADLDWVSLRALDEEGCVAIMKDVSLGHRLFLLKQMIPRLSIDVAVRPLTNELARIDITVEADCLCTPWSHSIIGELVVQVEDPSLSVILNSGEENFANSILYHEVVDATALIASQRFDNSDGSVSPSEYGHYETTAVVPLGEAPPPHYFVSARLVNWIKSEAQVAVPLLEGWWPSPPMPTAFVADEDAEEDATLESVLGPQLATVVSTISPFSSLTSLQTTIARTLLSMTGTFPQKKWSNMFVGMPYGKSFVSELLLLRLIEENMTKNKKQDVAEKTEQFIEDSIQASVGSSALQLPKQKLLNYLYLTCMPEQAARRYNEWKAKFELLLQQRVLTLKGNPIQDMQVLTTVLSEQQEAEFPGFTVVVVACAENFESILRHGREWLSSFKYVCIDHLHLLSTRTGGVYERVVSRLLTKPYLTHGAPRILGLSYCVYYAQSLAKWLRVPSSSLFNFSASERELQTRVEGVAIAGVRSRREYVQLLTLKRLAENLLSDQRTIVFVPLTVDAVRMAMIFSTKYRGLSAFDNSGKSDKSSQYANGIIEERHDGICVQGTSVKGSEETALSGLHDRILKLLATQCRVGYLHNRVTESDQEILLMELEERHPMVVFASWEISWRLPAALFDSCIICGTEKGGESQLEAGEMKGTDETILASIQPTEYTLAELHQMVTRAALNALVFCRQPRAWMLKVMLNSAIVVTSHLYDPLDHVDSVINLLSNVLRPGVNSAKQIHMENVLHLLTNSFFYNDSLLNPSFYQFCVPPRVVPHAILVTESDIANQAFSAEISAFADDVAAAAARAGGVLYDESRGMLTSTSLGSVATHYGVPILALDAARSAVKELPSAFKTVFGYFEFLCALPTVVQLPCCSVRRGERVLLQRLASACDTLVRPTNIDYRSPSGKALVLAAVALSELVYKPFEQVSETLVAITDEEEAAAARITLEGLECDLPEVVNAISSLAVPLFIAVALNSYACAIAAPALVLKAMRGFSYINALPDDAEHFNYLTEIPRTLISPPHVLKVYNTCNDISVSATGVDAAPEKATLVELLKQETVQNSGSVDVEQMTEIINSVEEDVSKIWNHLVFSRSLISALKENFSASAHAEIDDSEDAIQLVITVNISGIPLLDSPGSASDTIHFLIACYDGNNQDGRALGVEEIKVKLCSHDVEVPLRVVMKVPPPSEEEAAKMAPRVAVWPVGLPVGKGPLAEVDVTIEA